MSSVSPSPPASGGRKKSLTNWLALYAAIVALIAFCSIMFGLISMIVDVTRLLWPDFWIDPALALLPPDAPEDLVRQSIMQIPASITRSAQQSMVMGGITLVVAVPVFIVHWIILRRQTGLFSGGGA